MKIHQIYFRILFLFLFVSAVSACKEDPPNPPATVTPVDSMANVAIKFKAKFDGNPFDKTQTYITAAGDTIRIDVLRWLLSGFYLVDENNVKVFIKDSYAYLNLASSLNAEVDEFSMKLKKGNYKGFGFQMGLDSSINHGDPTQWPFNHPLNPALTGLHWGWAGGYIFNVIEGFFNDSGNMNSAFSFHVATLKYRVPFHFARDFSLDNDKVFNFHVNLNEYFENPQIFSLKTDGHTSHSGNIDPLMDKFIMNATDIFTFESVM